MADRYTGRHIHHARHTARAQRNRPPLSARLTLLPAAAALTITGMLIGGTGAVIQFGDVNENATVNVAVDYDPADYIPADRTAQANRTNRYEARVSAPTNAVSAPQAPVATGNCKASYYQSSRGTASGEQFNPAAFTAASKTLPFDSLVRVSNPANGRSVVVRINDRGPYVTGRCLDLSKTAFAAIASTGLG